MATIDAIREFIATERARFTVPGLSVAVVHDGEVLLCDGFGHADLENGRPADANTHFPLSSDTKAFTAATLCLMANAGLVDLDAPVREVLPWFSMDDRHATELVTPRDLLSHRTGLPRHDFMWFGGIERSLEETTRRLRHLTVSNPLRTVWDYNNLCYIAAGHLTEALAGTSWPDAVRGHLLGPLGMSNTVFSVHDVANVDLAQPYKATPDGFAPQTLPPPATAVTAGPAGGLVSTAADLARWLSARMGRRTDVLSDSTLAQLHRPAMLGGITVERFPEIVSLGYGLGCQVESYRGRRIVHHGGNYVGFSSDICVVPDAGVGIAVLTNLDSNYLRLPLIYGIIDRLAGDADAGWGPRFHDLQNTLSAGYTEAREHRHARASGAPPSRALDDFTGTYSHPAYGDLTIQADDDELVPRFGDVKSPLLLVHKGYDSWDLVYVEDEIDCPLVFTQGMDGSVSGLSVALEPAVAPIAFARCHEPAPDALLSAMAGNYRMGPVPLTIRLRGGTELVASSDLLGNMVLVSTGGFSFHCLAKPGIGITAELDPDGAVLRIVVDQVGIFLPEAR